MRTNRARRIWPLLGIVSVALAAACCEIAAEAASIDCTPVALAAPDTRIALNCTIVMQAGETTKSVTADDTIADPKP